MGKVSSKASPKPKAGKEPKPTKQLAEIKTCILNSELEEEVSSVKKLESDSIKVTPKANLTESHKKNDLEKLLELENKIKIEDRKRMKEEKSLTEQIKKKTGKATQKGKDKTEDSNPKDTKQSKMTDVKKRKTETTKSNLSDGSKFVIFAKKSPPKQKVKNDSIRPF